MLARRPADEGEDAFRREADDAATAVDDLFVALAAEPDPALDLALVEGQFDQCGGGRGTVRQRTAVHAACRVAGHIGSPSVDGNSRASKSRSMSATVMPRRKAATLMRPRSSGVMSIVRRAVNAWPATLLVDGVPAALIQLSGLPGREAKPRLRVRPDRKSTRLNSSH